MSSHQYNPAVILADRDATEDFGSCYGMLFVYSGNFLCEVEKDQIDQTRVIMGLGSALFSYPLEVGQEFFAGGYFIILTEWFCGTVPQIPLLYP